MITRIVTASRTSRPNPTGHLIEKLLIDELLIDELCSRPIA